MKPQQFNPQTLAFPERTLNSSALLLLVRPGAPTSVLATSSDARIPSSDAKSY